MEPSIQPSLISKELIHLLSFEEVDVLDSATMRAQRKEDLEKALHMGNADHNKVTIVFEDMFGTKQVETTIWGVTESYVILKKNTFIPIKSIYAVKFS